MILGHRRAAKVLAQNSPARMSAFAVTAGRSGKPGEGDSAGTSWSAIMADAPALRPDEPVPSNPAL